MDCPLCNGGAEDRVASMLEEIGVTGAALAAVHDVLAPCDPDRPCIARIRGAVEAAGARLARRLDLGDAEARPSLAAMLAVLECLDEEPLLLIVQELEDTCSARCHRRGPGGKLWRKAMTRVRAELLRKTGIPLLIEAAWTGFGPALRVARVTVDEKHMTAAAEIPIESLAVDIDLADRVVRLSQLAIVRRVGRLVVPSQTRRLPLRISGLRIGGDTRDWSELHNAIVAARCPAHVVTRDPLRGVSLSAGR